MKKLYFLLLILTMNTGVVVNAWGQTSKDSTGNLS